jgi:hypothetical protein
MFWVPLNEANVEPYLLQRRLELSDDAIFKFDDNELWADIDNIFSNTYFQRSRIIQEVAVAEVVYVIWGKWKFPWDIFCAAYRGQSFFSFKQWKKLSEAFSCVRDARKRYRDENFKSDLATVLATFNYSKETYPQDRIYASLGLVNCVWL